ncbi:ATP-binding Cassette (ABC) Superfamily [Phytophthora cinnamomi]|uniref:ATP-binding Cassette (ABC) Superfamily n=1 Tax=Phytophthora cinnamomi TaxID=4785 RepID=UPI0035597E22|nr:ATP-binding Cassette (ABC) Superfamily [Phytophthora cinnamomi]
MQFAGDGADQGALRARGNPAEAGRAQDRATVAPTLSVKNPDTKQTEDKQILSNVSGAGRPGELLVIMGPSGAGKSSLLDCISGRNTAVEGDIIANGVLWSKRLKRFSSYIKQDDMFYATIAAREHLIYQARLRMGPRATAEQHEERVDTVLEEPSPGTRLSAAFAYAVSPAANASAFRSRSRSLRARRFCSWTNPRPGWQLHGGGGDDSAAAVGTRGTDGDHHRPPTIIRAVLFTLFDTLYLLIDGAMMYNGKAGDAVAYFAELGYQCPSFANSSDYFMRQLVVLDKEKDEAGVKRLQLLTDEWERKYAGIKFTRDSGDATLVEEAGSVTDN